MSVSMHKGVDQRLAALPGHEVRNYYGRDELRVTDDRAFYGHTSLADRAHLRDVMRRARISGDDRQVRACEAAAVYSRVAYAYACGWYDALKVTDARRDDYVWQQRVMDACWVFGEECEWIEFAWEQQWMTGKHGFGLAWLDFLKAREIATH